MTARSSCIGRVELRMARRPRGSSRSPRSPTRSRSMAFRITSYVLHFTPVVKCGLTETSEKSINGPSHRSLRRRPRHSLRSQRRSSQPLSRPNLPRSQSIWSKCMAKTLSLPRMNLVGLALQRLYLHLPTAGSQGLEKGPLHRHERSTRP
jgi:hypothetical protein